MYHEYVVCNFSRYSVEDKKGIDIVLRFLQQLYVTYFNRDGMPTVENCLQEIFKYKNSTSEPLYYVRCDIQDAFGSVNQGRIYYLLYLEWKGCSSTSKYLNYSIL